MDAICFNCQHKNQPDQSFCGACGSPLALNSYVAKQVDARISEATRDRELVELGSAVRVFEKAYGWAKIVGGIAATVIAILVAGLTYFSIDLRSLTKTAEAGVEAQKKAAEKSITETATKIQDTSNASLQTIKAAEGKAVGSAAQAKKSAETQRGAISKEAIEARAEMTREAATVSKEVDSARKQIDAASKLQPEMTSLQKQLAAAQSQIEEQQRVITSSEDFAKKIFSSYRQLLFDTKTWDKSKFAVLDAGKNKEGTDRVILMIVLPETPVQQTLQVQFNQIPSAPGSFSSSHNVFFAYIQKPAKDYLLSQPVSVNYFPDSADKDIFQSLKTNKAGEVYGIRLLRQPVLLYKTPPSTP